MMRNNETKVIVFPCHINGLSIIRSLGRRGIYVIAIGYNKEMLGFASKYASESVIAPDPNLKSNEFVVFLLNKADVWRGSLLIPTNDQEMVTLARNRNELSKYYHLPIPNIDAAEIVVDKKGTYELARKLNIPFPKTIFVDSIKSLQNIKEEMNFPYLLKPRNGPEFASHFGKKAYIVHDANQANKILAMANQDNFGMMMQEIISGPDNLIHQYVGYYDINGNVSAEFTDRKLRQYPPFLGIARVAESTDTKEIIEPSRKLLNFLSFTGLCEIEYKKDMETGQYKLLDINGRSTMQLGLAIKCGIDFPWIMYNDVVLHNNIVSSSYSIGVKWIDDTVDIPASVLYLRREKFSIKEYCAPYFSPKTFAVFDRNDLMPSVKVLWKTTLIIIKMPFRLIKSLVYRNTKILKY